MPDRRVRSRRESRRPENAAAHREQREEQRAQRRQSLLDSAVDAVRSRGAGVSMEELAAAAGVTKPILYRHFGDRSGLVVAVAERFSAALLADLQRALTTPVEHPKDTLTAATDAFLRFIENDPEIYRFLVQRASADDAAHTALEGFLRRVGAEVAVVLGEQLAAAGKDAGGAEPLAHGIVGFVYGAGDWWIERRTMSRARLVEYLANTLWAGIEGMGLPGTPTAMEAHR